MPYLCQNKKTMNKNTMGAVRYRRKRTFTKKDKEQYKQHINQYAKRVSKEEEPVRYKRREEVLAKMAELVPAEQSEINMVQYNPRKARRKKK